jgi:hypothetical protein
MIKPNPNPQIQKVPRKESSKFISVKMPQITISYLIQNVIKGLSDILQNLFFFVFFVG